MELFRFHFLEHRVPFLSAHSLHLLMQAARHLHRIENTVLVLGNHAALSAKRRTFSELAVVSLSQNGDGLLRKIPSGPLILCLQAVFKDSHEKGWSPGFAARAGMVGRMVGN